MKYKIMQKRGGCAFEEYDNQKKEICNCGKESNIKVGHKFICLYHLPHIMMSDAKPEMEAANGKTVKFKQDFLKLANGEKVEHEQLLMDF